MKKNRKTFPFNIFRRGRIQNIISLSFSLVAVIGMAFLGIVLYERYVINTERMIIENNIHRIDQASWNLDSYVRNMMQISNTMYYSVIKNKDLGKETMAKEMALLYEANKDDLISIACFTNKGNLIAATPVSFLKDKVDPVSQEWFINANSQIENLHFSTPHVQNLFEDSNFRYYWVVSLSRAVELTNKGSTERGILLVDMNFSSIEQLFNKVNSKGAGYIYLMDGNGEIIYHPRQKLLYSNLLKENNIVANSYEDGEHTETFEKDKRVVIVKTMGYTGWKIVSVTSTSEFSINLNEMKFFTAFIIIFSIFVILFVDLLLSSKVTNPIKKLRNSVKLLENGNLNAEVYVGGSQEVQHLGRTINSMVKQMRNLMDDIVKEQEEKRKSELDALQAQINPHFLYNTLDSIVWMVETERYEEAISMVTALASLFRISLSKGKNIITIRDEVEHAKNYLSIQQIRFKNKFTSNFQIEPEILDCETIKLILQPIIENAIYYGMEFMDGDGQIQIHGYQKNGDIYIEVQDNGMGIPNDVVEGLLSNPSRTRKRGSGIGMFNVHQRIKLYFGNEYGLEVESELDEGTIVRIHLPLQYEKGSKGKEKDILETK